MKIIFVNEILDVKHICMPPVGMKDHWFEGTSVGEVCLDSTLEATF